MDTVLKRQRKLRQIAQQDAVYRAWCSSYKECQEAFAEFAATQPEEVRSFLWGYAESGRLIYQRMVNLACEHMAFPDEP